MEVWELVARESIRDLVARYNANGDTGRFEQMMGVFADDAVMEVVSANGDVRRFDGASAIAALFASIKSDWLELSATQATQHYVRHFTSTQQISVDARTHATGRTYFAAILPHGLDHWGRYIDEYELRANRWLIIRRRAITDGGMDSGYTDPRSVSAIR